jgi:hypothetical protein
MADITMCMGVDCFFRKTCYRYQAIPNEFWQSYFENSPRVGNECEEYIEIKEHDKIQLQHRREGIRVNNQKEIK